MLEFRIIKVSLVVGIDTDSTDGDRVCEALTLMRGSL